MDWTIQAAQLILSLSILVILHECGHFIPARLFKTRVEKFYLFFDPWFSLFKFKKGDTEYGIGWLPLGGYVKISGMIDESMDKEQMSKPPENWEFRAKPAWQRLIIMLGGVTVNLILGFFIYSMILFYYGDERLPLENMTYGVYVDSAMTKYGLQDGDKIRRLPESDAEFFGELSKDILINGAREIEIEREGSVSTVRLPDDVQKEILTNNIKSLFTPRYPFAVDSVIGGMNAETAGMLKDDIILSVDGDPTPGILEGLHAFKSKAGERVVVKLEREGRVIEKEVEISEEGKIGIGLKQLTDFIQTETYKYGFFESIPAGFTQTGDKLWSYISSMKLIFTKEGASQIGGFGAIGGLFSKSWNWHNFWSMTALISLILAFMNILPIPALDGGHVMFLVYEIISGRKPHDKVLEYAQMAGMVLLLSLLIFANGNDIFKLFK